jgi:DNA-binding NtrC family response regulator
LAHHFLELFAEEGTAVTLPDGVVQAMMAHDWPGNVRELQNAVHRYVTLREIPRPGSVSGAAPAGRSGTLVPVDGSGRSGSLIPHGDPAVDAPLSEVVGAFEKAYLERMLTAHHWHRSRVARLLGIDRRTLFRKIKAYGIELAQKETK